jgi:hypothetical protein
MQLPCRGAERHGVWRGIRTLRPFLRGENTPPMTQPPEAPAQRNPNTEP